MSDGVQIPLGSMGDLNEALKKIVIEFEDAGKNQDTVEEAIGRPLGRGDLKSAAHEFEGAWNDKRDQLKDHLVELQKRVEDTKKSWEDLDTDLQKQLDDATS